MQKKNISLECWTPEENALIEERGEFAIAINIGEAQCVDGYLFEYDPMLKHIIDLSSQEIDCGRGNRLHELIHFNITSRFLLLKTNPYYDTLIVGHYDTYEDAKLQFKSKTVDLALQIATNVNEHCTGYTIVDLFDTIPFFLKIGALRKPTKYAKELEYL